MRDVQSELDQRNIAIDKVGISGLSWPIQVLDRTNGIQDTVANVSLSVFLPRDYRGTHMSRFIEVLGEQENQVTFHNMENLLKMLQKRLDADEAHADFEFPYFITKKAPVSGALGRMRYDVRFFAELKGSKFDLITELTAPVQTLCPCSKEISDRGAHNQRAHAKISVRMKTLSGSKNLPRWLISVLLLRSTVFLNVRTRSCNRKSLCQSRFVEDSVRELSIAMEKDHRITWYNVSVTGRKHT